MICCCFAARSSPGAALAVPVTTVLLPSITKAITADIFIGLLLLTIP